MKSIDFHLDSIKHTFRALEARIVEAQGARDAWRQEAQRLQERVVYLERVVFEQDEKLRKAGL